MNNSVKLAPQIRYFNHACFAIKYEDLYILFDPYLGGTAFNEGWDLIANDINYKLDFSAITHIFYSHEHPDHFSVPFLKNIPEENRNSITILFQETLDKRVITFCKKLGFKATELEDKKLTAISNTISLRIGKVPFYDSWVIVSCGDFTIVNTNDCVMENPAKVNDIAKYIAKPNILFTQFSYANWIEGSADKKIYRQKYAIEKLDRLNNQVKVLNPEYVVPFASMVRFCHEENSYMNDSINTPKRAVEFISNSTGATALLMQPNQDWVLGEEIDNEESIKFWESKYKEAFNRPLIGNSPKYDENTLKDEEEFMKERIFKKNNKYLLLLLWISGFLPDIKIFLNDLNKSFEFSWGRRPLTQNYNREVCDIEMSSDSLSFIFKNDFGIDTLNVNARFITNANGRKKVIRAFFILSLNNTGRFLKISRFHELVGISFLKQGLKAIGLLKK